MIGVKKDEVAIGIDLGTTMCNIAVFEKSKVLKMIQCVTTGKDYMPSIVSFTDTDRLTFEAAKTRMGRNRENTVFEAKRLLGKRYNDPLIKQDIIKPFTVFDSDGKPKIKVKYKKREEEFHIEHILAILLSGVREEAEKVLNAEVKKAVITVPVTFTNGQRQATIDAGNIAGLDILRIMHEPVAAALAHDHIKGIEIGECIIVYDLGGGTFDVSIIVKKSSKTFEVIANAGDGHLGGVDFDHLLVDYVKSEFFEKSGKTIPNSARKYHILKSHCELVKCHLSKQMSDQITIASIVDDVDLDLCIQRSKFEDLIHDQLTKTMKIIEDCLLEVNLKTTAINQVIIIGGSSKIPKVKEMLSQMFTPERIFIPENPDTYVAFGAALQADELRTGNGETIVVLEKATNSIGLEIEDEFMDILIPKNHSIPYEVEQKYYNEHDNQTMIEIQVYEGEEKLTANNEFLGKFELTGITPNAAHSEQIVVKFKIDENGILQVTARDQRKPSNSNSITINVDKGRLTPDELNRLIIYEKNCRESKKMKERLETALAGLEGDPEKNSVFLVAKKWLENNPDATIAELEQQIQHLNMHRS